MSILEEVYDIVEKEGITVNCEHCGAEEFVTPTCDKICPHCNIGHMVSPLILYFGDIPYED